MTNENCKPEDIADLFLKFGGDPHAYQEFNPLSEANQSATPWLRATPGVTTQALVSGRSQSSQTAQPQTATAARSLPAEGGIPCELDALFARLAREHVSPANGAHGLLSQWRRQS